MLSLSCAQNMASVSVVKEVWSLKIKSAWPLYFSLLSEGAWPFWLSVSIKEVWPMFLLVLVKKWVAFVRFLVFSQGNLVSSVVVKGVWPCYA